MSGDEQKASGLRAVWLFFGLAYAVSWGAAGVLHLIALQAGLSNFGALMGMAESSFDFSSVSGQLLLPVPAVYLLTRVVDFGPSIAGLLTAYIVGGRVGVAHLLGKLGRWRVAPRWYALAILGPGAMALLAIALYALPGGNLPEISLLWPGTLAAFLLWMSVRTLLGGGLGEELGWRGFALRPLAIRMGPNMASLVIGVVWTFWHLPGHMISSSPAGSLIGQIVFTVPGSFLFTWLYLRTGGSVLIVVLLHGAFNGWLAFVERSLFPGLGDNDGWLIVFLLITLVLSMAAAASMSGETVAPEDAGGNQDSRAAALSRGHHAPRPSKNPETTQEYEGNRDGNDVLDERLPGRKDA